MSSILVVDDDVDVVRLLEASLRHKGHKVLTCVGGEQALEAASQFLPDLIVLDVEMPQMDGYQVLWHLNDRTETQHIPTLILSGRKSERDVSYGIKLGAQEYMAKPFSIDALLNRVDFLLKHSIPPRAQLN